MNNLQKDILNRIKTGEIDMKPKWHFVLKSLLLVLGVIVTALLVVYVLSFILFFLRQSGVGFMPLYGFRGISMFVMNSPWLLLAAAGGLVVILQLLVHKYSFSFRQPVLYSLVGIVVLVLVGSYAISHTQLHPHLRVLDQERGMPLVGPLYRGIDERRSENVAFGTVVEVLDNSFVLESDKGETITVQLTPKTKQPPRKEIVVGEDILVFGEREGSDITAIGVRPAPADFDVRPRGDRSGSKSGERQTVPSKKVVD